MLRKLARIKSGLKEKVKVDCEEVSCHAENSLS